MGCCSCKNLRSARVALIRMRKIASARRSNLVNIKGRDNIVNPTGFASSRPSSREDVCEGIAETISQLKSLLKWLCKLVDIDNYAYFVCSPRDLGYAI